MENVDFSKGMFFFKDYGVVFHSIEDFCTNEQLVRFCEKAAGKTKNSPTLHVYHAATLLPDVKYSLCYLSSKHDFWLDRVQFHTVERSDHLARQISDECTIYIPSPLGGDERVLISQLQRFGLKIIWSRDDIDEMLNFDECFDPGPGKYFTKRTHDKGRLWYSIIQVQPNFVDRVNVGYGSKLYDSYVSFSGDARIVIGRGSCLSEKPRFFLEGEFRLGSFCQVSTDFTCVTRRHAISNLSLGHISGGAYGFFGEGEDLVSEVIVGNDVWIGTKVIVLPGAKIHHGCVIAAGAVVIGECEPFGVYAGNPATLIRHRFAQEKIDILLESQWWDWPLRRIWEGRETFLNKVDELEPAQMRELLL